MTLEVIGQKLKAAREAQGLSLRQIYERTKIPINHLQAIDSGLPDDLPEPVYVAGFIKRYAECIGLDGQVLADEYRRDDSNGNGNGKPKTMVAQPVYATPEYLKHARIDNRAPSYKLWPFYAIVIVALMGVLHWYFTQSSNSSQPDPNVSSLKDSLAHMQQQPGATTGATTPVGTPNATTPTGTPAPNQNALVLTATKHVWVEVSKLNSGEGIYTGFMEQGESRTFDDPQGVRITAGNGGSLSVQFQGKTEPFGQNGSRSVRTFAGNNAVAAASSTDANAGSSNSSSNGTSSTAAATGTAGTSGTATASKPVKKIQKTVATKRDRSEDGYRSIGDSDGTRSIDVPYRYSEGRLDAN